MNRGCFFIYFSSQSTPYSLKIKPEWTFLREWLRCMVEFVKYRHEWCLSLSLSRQWIRILCCLNSRNNLNKGARFNPWWQPSPKSSKLLRCNPADGQDWLSWSKIKWSNICVLSCNLYMPTMDKRFDHFMYIESRMTSVTLRVKSSQSEWHGSNIVSLPCCNLSRLNDALN